jgi:hypothetical protein
MKHKIILLHLFTTPAEPSRFPPQLLHRGAIKLVVAPAQPTSSHMISHRLLVSFPMAEKKKKKQNREIYLKNKRELLSLRGVISLSLPFHGGVKLAHIEGHAGASTKPHESGVYDHDGVSYLLCARGSCISCSDGGICHGMWGIP